MSNEKVVKPEDTPLRITVENGQLNISVGVDTIAWAFDHLEHNNPYIDGDYRQQWKVTEPTEFARAVRLALTDENPDTGETLFTRLLDRSACDAVDNGCEGVEQCTDGLSAYARDYQTEASEKTPGGAE